MAAMPRLRPPHLLRQVSRHGTVSWVVRVGHGPRLYLRAPYGSAEFDAEYRAALAGDAAPSKPAKPGTGSLAGLWADYLRSQDWRALSLATQRQRLALMKHVLEESGTVAYAAIRRQHVIAGRDRRLDHPAAARHFVDALRGLFRWALDAERVAVDPTEGVKVAKPPTDGHEPWPQEWVDAFRRRWPLGTRERVAFELFYWTGLRRGDAAIVGRQHVKDGVLRIKTEKSGKTIEVAIPLAPALAEALAAGPRGDLAFIVGERGRPMTKESLGNWFREACDAAGVKGSAHGLRKTLATALADRGASEWELDAALGWTGGKTSAIYTRKANRARLAQSAHRRLSETDPEHPIPNPPGKVGIGDDL
jgi:integrase